MHWPYLCKLQFLQHSIYELRRSASAIYSLDYSFKYLMTYLVPASFVAKQRSFHHPIIKLAKSDDLTRKVTKLLSHQKSVCVCVCVRERGI